MSNQEKNRDKFKTDTHKNELMTSINNIRKPLTSTNILLGNWSEFLK